MKIKGFGTVRPVKSKGKAVPGSWQLVLSLGYDPLTKKRIQKTRLFHGNKTQAREALATFKREIENGLKLDADTILFKDYAEQWEKAREQSGKLAPASIDRGKYNMRHLLRYLSGVKLVDIETTTVRNLYIAMASDGIGQNSIAKAAITFKQILRQAMNDDLILRNPCDRVEAPAMPKSKQGIALPKSEIARLANALKDAESIDYPLAQTGQQRRTTDMSHTNAARLALAAGLRRGEVLALTWGDIDLDNATLRVSKTICTVTHKPKTPKTESSNRTVSLDTRMIADLRRWKNRQAQYLLTFGIRQSDETPVICSETGGHVDACNLDRWWRSFRKKYDFPTLRFHDLRHCHATMLVSSGLNVKAIQARMGHSNVSTTLNLYAHAMREDDEKVAAIIGDLMARPDPEAGQVINL